MNMQEFYDWLSQKSPEEQQRRLANLRRVSHHQILDATREGTWLVWSSGTYHLRLANLTRASRSQILNAVPNDPWLIWGAEVPST